MADRFIQSHIRQLPLFEQLSPPQIGVLSNIVELLRLEPGVLALQEGQPTQGMLLFVSGRGVITRRAADGTQESAGVVTAGQFIDEDALYIVGVEPFSLHIVESSVVLLIPRAQFVELITQYPEIRTNIRIPTGVAQSREAAAKLFKGQRNDETVLQVWRRHWWAMARHTWIALLVAFLLFGVALMLAGQAPVLALAAAGLAVIIPGVIVAYLYYDWQDDSVILTDQRVVHIWHRAITFDTSISEIPLGQVLEINTVIPPADVFARMFNYGNVDLKTTGRGINLFLSMMPNPMNIQTMVFTQRDRYRERAEQRQRDVVRTDVQQALGMHYMDDSAQQQSSDGRQERDATIGPPFLRTKFINANGDIVYRKHYSVWITHIFLPVLMIFAALIVLALSVLSPDFPLYGGVGLGIGMFMLVIGALWCYAADWDWRNDLFIVSNESITLIRQRPLWLQNNVEIIRVAQIDNVKSEVSGIFDSMLNRGSVRISLVGSDLAQAKVMDRIYDPQSVQAEISHRQSAIREERQRSDVDQQREIIKEYLQTYHEIQQEAQQPTQAFPTQPTVYPAAPREQPTDIPMPPPTDGSRPPRIPRSRPD